MPTHQLIEKSFYDNYLKHFIKEFPLEKIKFIKDGKQAKKQYKKPCSLVFFL
jgi:hypothetical protein